MTINKVVDFHCDIDGGAQCISFHMTCDSLQDLINECEIIKQYLNIYDKQLIPGKMDNTRDWKYKIGFYEAMNGTVTVGAI